MDINLNLISFNVPQQEFDKNNFTGFAHDIFLYEHAGFATYYLLGILIGEFN